MVEGDAGLTWTFAGAEMVEEALWDSCRLEFGNLVVLTAFALVIVGVIVDL